MGKCCIEITDLDDVKYASNVLWCMKHSILEGALYIPNDKSKYANSDIFDSIQNDKLDIKSKHGVTGICILGDMNARTDCLNEYTPMDNYVLENIGNEVVYNKLMIENSDYTTPKLSVDKKITAIGYKTLNVYNDNDLRILNGRFGRQKVD